MIETHKLLRTGGRRMPIYGSPARINVTVKTLLKKHCETQHAEPTETACRAHFQMHGPHYVTL